MSKLDEALQSSVSEAIRTELRSFIHELRQALREVLRSEGAPTVMRRGPGRPAGSKNQPSSASGRRGRKKGSGAPAAAGRRGGNRRAPDDGLDLNPAYIRRERTRLGLSQKDLAKMAGVTTVAVYLWESGQTRPSNPNSRQVLGSLANMSPDAAGGGGGRRRGGKKKGSAAKGAPKTAGKKRRSKKRSSKKRS